MGMMFITYEPIRTAVPSTIRNASITPSSRWRCFWVFDDNSSIDSWVLSPSSARPTAMSGIIMSVIISFLGFFLCEHGVYDSVLSWSAGYFGVS